MSTSSLCSRGTTYYSLLIMFASSLKNYNRNNSLHIQTIVKKTNIVHHGVKDCIFKLVYELDLVVPSMSPAELGYTYNIHRLSRRAIWCLLKAISQH